METMLAARLYGKNDLRVEKVPVPEIGPGEILLRVKAAAVCGTDLRMLQNGAAGVDESHPLTLAHEFSGVVERVGAGPVRFRAGQRVCVAPNIGCGVCDRCVAGMSHHCAELRALGVHMDGGFAEFVRIPADAVRLGNVVALDGAPDDTPGSALDGASVDTRGGAPRVSFEAAAANEAFSCVYNAFLRYRVHPGETVVIIGAGAIGLMHAKLAKMAGAAKIILNDLSADRLRECAAIE
ncbi:MAG: alcohol dehydrogenase catalytic domain-containing protein, partial [Clostridiales bacterium]|nr:alcohol dehydrogenase catalytic domain-containing protein [Clostridiales bacterium]